MALLSKYRSLETPNFEWVQVAYQEDPTKTIRERLAHSFDISEFTDLNNDVSVGYELYEPGGTIPKWALRLSMVGPYAMLVRNTPNAPNRMLVDGLDDCQDPSEKLVAAVLDESGLELLDREALSTPVPLRLFVTEPHHVRMYQALFTDTEFMPGEFELLTDMTRS